ncbi:MAG: hypothetical protein ACFB21_12605 [Opitutales bacterium]
MIASSVLDWDTALNDGKGMSGAAVDPGSLQDIAQQGHPDLTGSGIWEYGRGTSGDGAAFAGGFPLLNVWEGGGWSWGAGYPFITGTRTTPTNTSGADQIAYRRWTSTGAFAGDLITATLTFSVNADNPGDGVTMLLNSNAGSSVPPLTKVIAPSEFGTEFELSITIPDAPDRWVLAGALPDGPDTGTFFNDAVNTELVITQIPEPSVAGVHGGLSALLMARRRR